MHPMTCIWMGMFSSCMLMRFVLQSRFINQIISVIKQWARFDQTNDGALLLVRLNHLVYLLLLHYSTIANNTEATHWLSLSHSCWGASKCKFRDCFAEKYATIVILKTKLLNQAGCSAQNYWYFLFDTGIRLLTTETSKNWKGSFLAAALCSRLVKPRELDLLIYVLGTHNTPVASLSELFCNQRLLNLFTSRRECLGFDIQTWPRVIERVDFRSSYIDISYIKMTLIASQLHGDGLWPLSPTTPAPGMPTSPSIPSWAPGTIGLPCKMHLQFWHRHIY